MNTDNVQKIQRIYRVRLRANVVAGAMQKALEGVMPIDAGIAEGGWFEPTEITLWWDVDAAPERGSKQEASEVARRAVRLERQNFTTDSRTTFEVEILEVVRERLVTPKPRKRAPVPA